MALIPLGLRHFEALQETSIYLPLVVALIVLTALGAPIFVAIGGVAAVLLWHEFFPVSAIPTEAYNLAVKPMLPTIPLFTPRGLHSRGGRHTAPGSSSSFARSSDGFPGASPVAAIVVCAFFTSFTGGSGVTILAMGGLLFPMLLERKYSPKFATGLLTSRARSGCCSRRRSPSFFMASSRRSSFHAFSWQASSPPSSRS